MIVEDVYALIKIVGCDKPVRGGLGIVARRNGREIRCMFECGTSDRKASDTHKSDRDQANRFIGEGRQGESGVERGKDRAMKITARAK